MEQKIPLWGNLEKSFIGWARHFLYGGWRWAFGIGLCLYDQQTLAQNQDHHE
jgi:hypothetical protein